MHSLSGMGLSNVPAFLTKLWQLVEDSSFDEFIAWDVVSFYVTSKFVESVIKCPNVGYSTSDTREFFIIWNIMTTDWPVLRKKCESI